MNHQKLKVPSKIVHQVYFKKLVVTINEVCPFRLSIRFTTFLNFAARHEGHKMCEVTSSCSEEAYQDNWCFVLSCFSRVCLFETLWTTACQAPLSMVMKCKLLAQTFS